MANKVYFAPETQLTFTASGGDVVFTCDNIASSAGRKSARYDQSTGSKPTVWLWRGNFTWVATPTQGGRMDLFLVTWDNAGNDPLGNGYTTGDEAISDEDGLRNLVFLGSVICQEAAAGEWIAEGYVMIRHRYFALAMWNRGGSATNSTANTSFVTMQPVPDEVQ